MKPRLLITTDTELSNFPEGQGLWGRIGEEDWGLGRMLRVFQDLGVQGTFFLDVYGGNATELGHQQRAAEMIFAAGHDLQLHTHPGPAFDRARPRLRDYTLAEQSDIIAHGAGLLEKWVGQRPRLHRAGDWGANRDSLDALKAQGMLADFSASAWSPNCDLDAGVVSRNGWARIDGLLCGMGTSYRDGITGRMRRVDLGGASYAEVLDILSRRIDPMFLTLHSFSLMTYDRSRTRFYPNAAYIELLASFCRTATQTYGYEISTALQAAQAMSSLRDDELPSVALPTTRTWPSFAGIVKSVHGRIASRML